MSRQVSVGAWIHCRRGGVGAGGDVEGLISAGMDVIGFENDLEQCKELVSIWSRYESNFKEKGVLGWVEQEPWGPLGECTPIPSRT